MAEEVEIKHSFNLSLGTTGDDSNNIIQVPPRTRTPNIVDAITTYSNKTVEIWTIPETDFLIDMYVQHKEDFLNAKKKKDVWVSIAQNMERIGIVGKNADRCENKWKNLLRTFRAIKDLKTTKNHKPQRFAFYDQLEKVVGDLPVVKRKSFIFDSSYNAPELNNGLSETCEVILSEVVCDSPKSEANYNESIPSPLEIEVVDVDPPKKREDGPRASYFKRKLELKEKAFELKKFRYEERRQERETRLAIEQDRLQTLKELLAVQKALLNKKR